MDIRRGWGHRYKPPCLSYVNGWAQFGQATLQKIELAAQKN